jgi:hypothetical protein
MSVWATVADVQDRYEAAVPDRTQVILDDAEALLGREVAGIATRIALASSDANWLDPALVRKVLCDAVIRLLRNPRSLSWEREGGYSYGMPISFASSPTGGVQFTRAELDLLSPTANRVPRVGTIQLGDPYRYPRIRWAEPPVDVWRDSTPGTDVHGGPVDILP